MTVLFQPEMRSEGSQARWRYERVYPVDPGKPLKHFIREVAKSGLHHRMVAMQADMDWLGQRTGMRQEDQLSDYCRHLARWAALVE